MLAYFTSAKTQSGLHCLAAVPWAVASAWAVLDIKKLAYRGILEPASVERAFFTIAGLS